MEVELSPLMVAEARGVQAAAQLVVGKPVGGIGRAGGMLMITFGESRVVPNRRNPSREVGEYAIHTEAPWRILGPEGIVTGRRDCFYTTGDPEFDYEGDQTDRIGGARFDEQIRTLRDRIERGEILVESAGVGEIGSLRFSLSGGLTIEVFPVDSTSSEQWRMFRPGADERHLVLTVEGPARGSG